MKDSNKNSQTTNASQTVECIKCHKKVASIDAKHTSKGFICKDCSKGKKRNIIAAGISLVVVAGIIGGSYFSSSKERTASGFDGVEGITDSMNVSVDSVKVAFDMSTATAISSPISTQSPISNITDFKRAMEGNVSNAQNGITESIVIPAVSLLFDINTATLINNADGLIDEFAQVYLKTNKKATVSVEGYTCDLGSEQLNMDLSRLRAETVKKVLIEAGIPLERVETKWYGKSRYNEFKFPAKSEYRRVVVSIK